MDGTEKSADSVSALRASYASASAAAAKRREAARRSAIAERCARLAGNK